MKNNPSFYPAIPEPVKAIRKSIFATLSAEGASCSFKQTGVKEVPVFEIVCDKASEGHP